MKNKDKSPVRKPGLLFFAEEKSLCVPPRKIICISQKSFADTFYISDIFPECVFVIVFAVIE